MVQVPQESDHKGAERAESKAERIEKKAEIKGRAESSEGMEDHSKKVAVETKEKRVTRKSGVTGKFAENGKPGLASADSLLPLEDPNKPKGREKADRPAKPSHRQEHLKAMEAAGHAFESVYKAGSNAVSETGKFLKGMGDGAVEFVKEFGDSLNVAGAYYGRALSGKVNLAADIKEFSGAIGQTLGTAGDYYFKQLPKGQANLGKDLAEAGKAAADHWNSLDTEHKGKFIGKEVVPLLVPGAVGMVAKDAQAANLVGKTGKAIAALAGSEKVAELEQKITAIQSKLQQMHEMANPLKPAHAMVTDGAGRKHVSVETSKMNDAVLMKHGDKGLPQGIKPSEKVHVTRTVSANAEVIHQLNVPEEVLKAAEKQGIDRITAQEKLQKVAEAIKNSYYQVGDYDPKIHGTERAYGNKFHEVLRSNLNKQADPLVHTEASYLKGTQAEWGKLGTSRVDISLGEKHEPFASLCLKTLKAVPSAQQERGWVRNLPKLKDGSVPPRLHVKLPPGADL